jgi:hypothetical protein
MKNYKELFKALKKRGFILKNARGGSSSIKIYPPIENKPFYTYHEGEKGIHDLRRFAKKNWEIDLKNI